MKIPVKTGDSLDLRVFVPSVLVIVGLMFPLIIFPESGAALVSALFAFATGQFGWLYLLAGLGAVVFLVGLVDRLCAHDGLVCRPYLPRAHHSRVDHRRV
ncbi:MAG TPA: BCCT family transporter, partial [Marinobacter sp.]|nr:BCCT family transporter [Marinobacter sp.]